MTGQAVSNVFNDKMELNGGTGIVTVLKGIPHRSNIGFLSLFEHYGNCQVKNGATFNLLSCLDNSILQKNGNKKNT